MPQRRDFPYIWATWLPRLLTGENSCEWAVWFKAHYQDWDRVPSDFNQTDWLVRHTSMLNEQKAQWEDRGHDVYVENQNTFRLQGETAVLAGKPDLVVVHDDDARIVDVKSGKEQPSHRVQLMIYMYALPRALEQYQHATGRTSGLSDADSTSTNGKSPHPVQNGPRSLDPPDCRGPASCPSPQRTRMPLLRHHRRGLPCPCQRRPNDARGDHFGILTPDTSLPPVSPLPPHRAAFSCPRTTLLSRRSNRDRFLPTAPRHLPRTTPSSRGT